MRVNNGAEYGQNMAEDAVTDIPGRSRYEMPLGADVAIAVYRDAGDVRTITHTEVPEALRGKGIGGKLVRGVLDDIRARNMKVIPRCPFVARYIAAHPGYADLVAR
jgi:predicted GNAT family acetyltransferase